MSLNHALKALILWFAIMICAIGNGILREGILLPLLGRDIALPLSGLILSAIIVLVTLAAVPVFGRNRASTYVWIGVQWLILTLLFEVIFGRFAMGKSWAEIARIFDIRNRDLFLLVLCATAASPRLAAGWRHRIENDNSN